MAHPQIPLPLEFYTVHFSPLVEVKGWLQTIQ